MTSEKTTKVTAALGLGSNMGDRQAFLARAVDSLAAHPSIKVIATSAVYETPPWGKTDQSAFLNAAVLIETGLLPRALLEAILGIERALGRVRGELWGPRTIDIDILLYGDRTADEPGLTVPHPRIRERAFVLRPLADILPDATVASHTILDWLSRVDVKGIRSVEQPGWHKKNRRPAR